MTYAVCPLSVVPIRSSASDKSEMVSQLLFGETVELMEQRGSWVKVRCLWDNYIGWADHKQLKSLSLEDIQIYQKNYALSLELFQGAMHETYSLPITIGATLPRFDGLKFHLNGSSFTFSGQAVEPQKIKQNSSILLKIARRYLYAPYLWGGRSPFGIDCSGFTQMAYKMIGIPISRDASQQVEGGRLIDFIEQAQPGDLAFFENKKGRIVHVGILLPGNQIIHASGQVRIDRLDHFGIFNEELNKYTHKLRVIKRVLEDEEEPEELSSLEEIGDPDQVVMF